LGEFEEEERACIFCRQAPFFFLREEKGFSMVNLFGEEVSLLGDHLAGFHSLVWEDFLLEEDG
jgi:hypothetical protein